MQRNNELARIPGVQRVQQSAPKVNKSEQGRGRHIGCPCTHYSVLAGEVEASIDRHRIVTLDLGVGPMHNASDAYNIGLAKRTYQQRSRPCCRPHKLQIGVPSLDTRGLPRQRGREGRLFLPFGPGTTEVQSSTTLVPRRMTMYLVILPKDDLRYPLIQILHLTFIYFHRP